LPGAGSYAVTVLPSGGGQGLNLARAVASPGSSVMAYSYDTSASSSQPHDLELADFGASGNPYPSPFTQVVALAAQGVGPTGAPTLLNANPTAGAGTQTVTPATGPVSLLVFADPEATSSGLFGLNWTAGGTGSTPDFETTQGVGSLASTRTISVTTSGVYEVTIADAGFPASFSSLAAYVTRGSSTVGSIHAAGSFTFSATPGNYDISVMAQPGGSTVDSAGTYSISVATAPPSPPVGGKGGGGAVGGDLLAVLLASAGLAAWRRMRRA
jgi:hypothetical protein